MTTIEQYAQDSISAMKKGDFNAANSSCFACYREIQNNPENLKKIDDQAGTGICLVTLLSFEEINDDDTNQAIASIAFLLLCKAVEKDPKNTDIRKSRFVLMQLFREPLQNTIIGALNLYNPYSFMSNADMATMSARDIVYKMMLCELAECSALINFDLSFAKTAADLMSKVKNGFFGAGQDIAKVLADGVNKRKRIVEYLSEKLFDEADIEF